MEAMEELIQLSQSMMQGAALLADEDIDESSPSPSSKRSNTFLNVVVLGNVVSVSRLICCLIALNTMLMNWMVIDA